MVLTRRLRLRRSRLRAERGTQVLAGATVAVTSGALFAEWRRLRARHPEEQPSEALREAVGIVAAGYRTGTPRENALFNLLAAFSVTFGLARLSTYSIRRRGTLGPFRNLRVANRHVHHFIPGIVMAFLAGGTAVATRSDRLDAWLALPFGAGVALTLDESALLLELDDVYWTEEGVVSVQIAFAAMAMLSALAYLIQMLRHREGHETEADWELAAKAWDDLQMIPGIGGSGIPGIGG
jgi:hypothetical protein